MDDMDEKGGGAPKFMVLYCSIMILLLAFFITLQSLAEEQQPGLFHTGKGSFVRALNSFGLGRYFGSQGLSDNAKVGRRYPMDGASSDSRSYPSDPELTQAQKQLQKMKENLEDDSEKSEWAATLFAPGNEAKAPEKLTTRQKKFFESFATGALPALFAKNSLIGVGARYPSNGNGGENVAARALLLAGQARQTVIKSVDKDMEEVAQKRVYSFCRPADEDDGSDKIRVYLEAVKLEKVTKETDNK